MVDGVINIPLPGPPLFRAPDSTVADQAPASFDPPAFDHFLAGPENQLVDVAVRGVLGDRPQRFSPLVIHGPSGTGKSHVARGLAIQWSRHSADRIECVTAGSFCRDLADAFEVHSVVEFRARLRECELLVIEDVQQLTGKAAAQEELVHTLDALADAGATVIATASDHPSRLAGLCPALRGRLVEGLTVPLLPPGSEVRGLALRRLARLRRVELRRRAAELLAEKIAGTVPELAQALVELEQPARLEAGVIDYEMVRAYLENRAQRSKPRIRDVAVLTARYFSLRLADLRGSSRRRNVVNARSVAMYLARTVCGLNFQQIGQYFGGRDHTTVMHGYRKIRDSIKSDPVVREAVDTLQSKWRGVET